MKAKRSIKTVVIAAIILAAGCGLAGVIDQRQDDVNLSEGAWAVFRNEFGMERNLSLWQSFQAGVSGSLRGVELYWSGFNAGSTVDLCLYDGTGVDTGLLIRRETITFPEYTGQTWHLLSFSLYPALLAGNTYTFALEDASDSSASIQAGSLGVDSYANGVFWMQGYSSQGRDVSGAGDTDWDVGFRTVMVPEPATALILGLGGAVIALYRRFFGRV